MKVLIVEDVTLVAERIQDLTKKYLENCSVKISHTLEGAKQCLTMDSYDLLFLDLNLNGKDGFDLLTLAVASSFHTIVITANRNQASSAFDYGVLDFISKPISENRFKLAIERLLNKNHVHRERLKYLTIKSKGVINLIVIKDISYIKASGNYSEVYTMNNESFLHDKNVDKLLKILPQNFIRIHRSYIISKEEIGKIIKYGGGKYEIELTNRKKLPLSRSIYKKLFMNLNDTNL